MCGDCFSATFNMFFLAEKAFGDDGNLRQPKQLSINKVGHGVHLSEHVDSNFGRIL